MSDAPIPAADPAADHAARVDDPTAGASATTWWPLSKAQAFCLHLTLSLLVFSTLVWAMLVHWFPGALFALDGGWEGLKLVAMVDLVLGPALTLLLYKPGKPKLALDMSLIAGLQIAALAYGFVATHQQRTVAVVFADGMFNTLSAQAHAEANGELAERGAAPREIAEIAAGRPPLLLTPPPGKGEFGKYLEELFNGWPEPHERSDRYVALAPFAVSAGRLAERGEGGPEIGAARPADAASVARDTLARAALGLDDIEPAMREAVETALDDEGLAPELVQLHRFKARYAGGIAIYDPAAARILEWVRDVPADA